MRAIWLISAALLVSCGTAPVYRGVERALLKRDFVAAKQRLDQALAKRASDVRLLGLQMRLAFAEGRPAQAIGLYQRQPSHALARELALARVWAAMVAPDRTERLAGIHTARALNAEPLIHVMRARLLDPDPMIKTWAAIALSQDPDGAFALQKQLRADRAEVRALALDHVAAYVGLRALVSIRAAAHGSVADRVAAARALGRFGVGDLDKDKRTASLWIALLGDKQPKVVTAALRGLRRKGDGAIPAGIVRALGFVLEGLSADSPGRSPKRRHALKALANLLPEQAKRTLPAYAASKDVRLALFAGALLARAGGPIQPLLNAIAIGLVNQQPSIRVLALNTAAQASDPAAHQIAAKALGDRSLQVRLAAAHVLRRKKAFAAGVGQVAERVLADDKAELGAWLTALSAIAELRALKPSELLRLKKVALQAKEVPHAIAAFALLPRALQIKAAVGGLKHPRHQVALAAASALYRRTK